MGSTDWQTVYRLSKYKYGKFDRDPLEDSRESEDSEDNKDDSDQETLEQRTIFTKKMNALYDKFKLSSHEKKNLASLEIKSLKYENVIYDISHEVSVAKETKIYITPSIGLDFLKNNELQNIADNLFDCVDPSILQLYNKLEYRSPWVVLFQGFFLLLSEYIQDKSKTKFLQEYFDEYQDHITQKINSENSQHEYLHECPKTFFKNHNDDEFKLAKNSYKVYNFIMTITCESLKRFYNSTPSYLIIVIHESEEAISHSNFSK